MATNEARELLATLVQLTGDNEALKATLKRVHPDWNAVPKGTRLVPVATELLDTLHARLDTIAYGYGKAKEEISHITARLDAVTRERDALRADARRFRFLCDSYTTVRRDCDGYTVYHGTDDSRRAQSFCSEPFDTLREAVDYAMAKEPPNA